MENILEEVKQVSLDGELGETTPVAEGEVVVCELDDIERRIVVLIARLVSDINEINDRYRHVLVNAANTQLYQAFSERFQSETSPLLRQKEALQRVLSGSIAYRFLNRPDLKAFALREKWQVVSCDPETQEIDSEDFRKLFEYPKDEE